MKCIDAERLRKEVKGLERAAHKSALGCADSETRKFHEGKDFAYQHVGILIDSLQQEQTDFPITDEQIKEFLATHPKIEVPEKYKNPDWLFKKQEQPEADLEKEIDRVSKRYPEVSFAKLSRIAVHFTKWKEAQDQEIIELAEDHAYLAGAVNEREKIMKEAVEGYVTLTLTGVRTVAATIKEGDNIGLGDKVRVIVLKED